MRSLAVTQKLDEAERNDAPVKIVCDQCGNPCISLGKPTNSAGIMSHETAMILSRFCEPCSIVVCGRCAGVSPQMTLITSYPCPRCGGTTVRAAACHLRLTRTKLLEVDESSATASGGSGNCFIATAAFGSGLEPQVQTLRTFRDTQLAAHLPGRAFIRLYNRIGPCLACLVQKSAALRNLVRFGLTHLTRHIERHK